MLEVTSVGQGLGSGEQIDRFRIRLNQFTESAINTWKRIQRVKKNIESEGRLDLEWKNKVDNEARARARLSQSPTYYTPRRDQAFGQWQEPLAKISLNDYLLYEDESEEVQGRNGVNSAHLTEFCAANRRHTADGLEA